MTNLSTGIIGCGVYIPRLRIKREEYQKAWGFFALCWLEEKAVTDFDEDAITMGVEAASNVIGNSRLDASQIDAVYFASTSQPYVEKQSSSTISAALGCRSDTTTLDITGSTRSGTSALLSCLDFVSSGRGRVGLVIAADCPLGDPTETLEHQLGSAAAAIIVGREGTRALIDGSFSVSSETIGERFRRDGESFVTTVDVGRYHENASDEAIMTCANGLLKKLGRTPRDFDWFTLQGLDDGRARDLSKKLGFEESKVTPTLISSKLGDAGTASSLISLSKVLESASPKQHVLLCSYGAGAGVDALSIVVDAEMKPNPGIGYSDYLSKKEYVDYSTYMKLRGFLGRG